MIDPGLPDEGIGAEMAEIARSLVEKYQRSPLLRMLVQLYPPAALVETGILATYAGYQHRRLEVFVDEFITLGLGLSEEDVKKKEFFDAFTSTAQHVLSESRDDKIKLFARLFAGFVAGECATPIDRYEEHLLVLDMLSEREYRLLLLLNRHEANCPMIKGENRLERCARFWVAFEEDANRELGLGKQMLRSTLDRVARTGMYVEITGAYYDYGGGRGYLSAEFQEFLDALQIQAHSKISREN